MTPKQPTRAEAAADPELRQSLDADLDDAVSRTLELVHLHAAAAIQSRRPLTETEHSLMLSAAAAMPRQAITTTDLLNIVVPDAPWFDENTIEEGIRNHAEYHAARPGECGRTCPGQLPLPPEPHTPPGNKRGDIPGTHTG